MKGRTYWYAWRGGPRLSGEPGSPEFIASYNEAFAQRRAPDKNHFRFVVADYKVSREYNKLAESTRAQWGNWLDRIGDHFGELRVAQLDRPEKIRPLIRRWRNHWADTPRTADYALQVLSRVAAHAVELGRIAGNPCESIKHLYNNDRSETIWTDADVTHIKRTCSADGFGSSFNKAKIDAGMPERDLHFNDLRGTAATKFFIAGFSMREIAETLAWEEESVEKIIRRYVGRAAAIKARITKLEIRK